MIKIVNSKPCFMDTPKSWRMVKRHIASLMYCEGIEVVDSFNKSTTVLAPKELGYWEVSDD